MSGDVTGTRVLAPRLLAKTRAIAVLRASHARDCAAVVDALLAGGICSIELTLSTPGVIDELPLLRRRFGDAVELGVGTVTAAREVDSAVDAGAEYVVTPITATAILDAAARRAVPVYPGGLTPSELFHGWSGGATAVKIFPASLVGPGYISQLQGPFPAIEVVPSGGVEIGDVSAWITAGAAAVSLGGPLIGDALRGGDLTALTERARRVRDAIEAVVPR
jgi:2-dehydro-3-deoxyphosphogluconate aldolase/(4S)-4-hydroxy-2-oxoglutarate aldolase